jgi:AraC-like DNA-binding protein
MERAVLNMGRKQRVLCLRRGTDEDWRSVARAADFKIHKLAQVFGLSTRQLERLVRARFNLAPREFLMRERMLAARILLPAANSIKETSFQLGYSHATIFNRHFKQFYGVTPTQFLLSRAV